MFYCEEILFSRNEMRIEETVECFFHFFSVQIQSLEDIYFSFFYIEESYKYATKRNNCRKQR